MCYYRVYILVIITCILVTHGDGSYTSLKKQSLTSVPANIDPATTTLDLFKNLLTRVENDSFTGLSAITDMRLHQNQIVFVDDSAFHDCIVLEMVVLSDNRLVLLTPYGQYPQNIKILGLHNNGNLFFLEDLFLRYGGAISVVMDNVGLKYVPEFPRNSRIERFQLLSNPINTVSDLSYLRNLTYFKMDTTGIICDWKICWMLFETFNVSGRPPYYNSFRGTYFGPECDLDVSRLVCSGPEGWADEPLANINPIELQCYNSKLMHPSHYSLGLYSNSAHTHAH